jgi:NAD(P)-dependent dehydrogenase (short-subunit alcohol dehydrogenase family)
VEVAGEMTGRQVLVVGGSYGIGATIAQQCLDRGASVTVVARTRGETPSGAEFIAADATSDSYNALQLPETLDGLVYAPGSIQLGPLRSVSLNTIREDFELNVLGAVRVMQHSLTALKRSKHSSCVLFSTVAVAQGLPMHTSIAAAKGALEALTRTWAAELSPAIRVNCIAPALTDTRLAAQLLSNDEKRAAMAAKYPLGRLGTAADSAAAALYLLSDASGWMTGQVLHIDGGMSTVRKLT